MKQGKYAIGERDSKGEPVDYVIHLALNRKYQYDNKVLCGIKYAAMTTTPDNTDPGWQATCKNCLKKYKKLK